MASENPCEGFETCLPTWFTVFAMVTFLAVLFVALVVGALFRPGRVRLVLLATGLFTALAALVVGINSDWSVSLDTSAVDWFDAHRTRRRDEEAAGIFRYVGSPLHVLTAAVVCGVPISLYRRSVVPVGLICGAVAAGVIVEQTLKATIGRSTPSELLPYYAHSFPSGHVTGAAALLGSIAICFGAGRSSAVRGALAGLVTTGVLVVAWLALYTGAHTLIDVLGGMCLGGGIVALCGTLYGPFSARSLSGRGVRHAEASSVGEIG